MLRLHAKPDNLPTDGYYGIRRYSVPLHTLAKACNANPTENQYEQTQNHR